MASQLSRYKFSRAVCHRMDLVGPRASGDEEDEDDEQQQQQEETEEPEQQQQSREKAVAKKKAPPSRSQSHSGYSSPRVNGSKSLSASLSFSSLPFGSPMPSDCSGDERSGSKGQGRKQLRRLVSWSRYLEARGDEQAVEEAEEWMIDLSQLLLGQKFASGAHSRLYHGIYQGRAVAVKITRQPQAGDDTSGLKATLDRLFAREVSLLSKLNHPNIVELIGACKRPPVCCVVTEYLGGGSLRDYLLASSAPLPLDTVVEMALDIAHGMKYLHSQGVVHRDLKSANLILSDEFKIKITDLGVATIDSDCANVTSDVGTYRWMAPELVNRKAHSRKVDIYSFGIVMWELVTGQVPFQDMTPVQAAYAVVNKNARPEIPSDCPSIISRLMQECWSAEPDGRPESDQVVEVLERFQSCIEKEAPSHNDS